MWRVLALDTRSGDLPGLAENWATFIQEFKHCDDWLGTDDAITLGKRLTVAAPEIATNLVDAATQSPCIIHGDAKALNMFLDTDGLGADGVGSTTDGLGSTLIDFQWTGIGVGASDVAMHLTHALTAASFDEKEELIEHYLALWRDCIQEDIREGVQPRAVRLRAVRDQCIL